MAIQPGRYDKRSAATVAVMLTSRERAFTTELTVTENISERGARVLTKKLWWANDALVIKSLEGDLQRESSTGSPYVKMSMRSEWSCWRQRAIGEENPAERAISYGGIHVPSLYATRYARKSRSCDRCDPGDRPRNRCSLGRSRRDGILHGAQFAGN
jgi:hypothetical protein